MGDGALAIGPKLPRPSSTYMRPPMSRIFRWCLAISIAFGYGCGARSSPAAAKRCAEGAGLCVGHVRQLGGESPLCNLMEVKH
jgi:hypothetical protein